MKNQVDVNSASRDELINLKGIGESLADRIITFREKNGPLDRIEDLTRIDGIKEGTLKRLREIISVAPTSQGKKTKVQPKEPESIPTEKKMGRRKSSSAEQVLMKSNPVLKPDKSIETRPTSKLTKVFDEITSKAKELFTGKSEQTPIRKNAHPKNRKNETINGMSVNELIETYDINPDIAAKIIEFKHEHGGIYSIDDLKGEPAIDRKMLSKLKSLFGKTKH